MGDMAILNVKDFDKVLVVGPIYDNLIVLDKCKKLLDNYDLIIFNGGLTYPLDKFKTNLRLQTMSDLLKTKKVIYNISEIDYKLSIDNSEIAAWLVNKPNAVRIEFKRGTFVLVVGGGISLEMKEYKNIINTLEVSFIKKINNKPWHQSYNGRFGYVISNNPLSQNHPNFFNYSAQIGIDYQQNKVYAQEVNENGLGETILL